MSRSASPLLCLILTVVAACGADRGDETGGDSSADASDVADTSDLGTSDSADAGGSSDDASDGGTAGDESPPTDAALLDAWLAEGSYLDWPSESGPHDSAGPHFGDVRTFVNPVLDESLAAGASAHPAGAAAVKELYGSGSTVLGYSVSIKTQPGTSGSDWWWYEVYNGQIFAAGQGDSLCTGCHGDGADYVWTPYPLQ